MKPLYRSRTNRMVAGIFGGIGEMYHIDPTILRLAFAVFAVITGFLPAIVLYLVAWAVIPESALVPVRTRSDE